MQNDITKAQYIGDRIKTAREDAGMSQTLLAKELEFESASAISLIEKGERKITVENLEKIAKFLKKDIKYFLGEKYESIQVEYALRADANLGTEDKEAIMRFIEMAKENHAKRKRK